MSVLIGLTKNLSVGTNLALLHILWMLVSGALLPQRGAMFPALKAIGLSDEASRRAWAGFRGGGWQTSELVRVWRAYVEGLAAWQVHVHEGYRVVAVDVTGFWRPSLQNCPSKHYHPAAQRALPAVIMGIVAQVGEIGGQRLASPRAIERVHPQDGSEKSLWQTLLRQVKRHLAADEIAVMDAGVKLRWLEDAEMPRYGVRLPINFTARRSFVAPYSGKGRQPTYGQRVRPLPRARKDKTLPAAPPDRTETWEHDGRTIRADIWEQLVRSDVKPSAHAHILRVYALHDPLFSKPWLLATPLLLQAKTVYAIYRDRWSVEQIPLAAKHMVGAHRQFVHADESVQRLPELALLAGSILSFLAATVPPTPTGFWDRQPKRTPGRFRRTLMGQPFPQSFLLPDQFRKKASVTTHLPKGFEAVRAKIARLRQPSAPPALPYGGPT